MIAQGLEVQTTNCTQFGPCLAIVRSVLALILSRGGGVWPADLWGRQKRPAESHSPIQPTHDTDLPYTFGSKSKNVPLAEMCCSCGTGGSNTAKFLLLVPETGENRKKNFFYFYGTHVLSCCPKVCRVQHPEKEKDLCSGERRGKSPGSVMGDNQVFCLLYGTKHHHGQTVTWACNIQRCLCC